MSKEKQSLITDISEAKNSRNGDQAPTEDVEDRISGDQFNEDQFQVNEDDPINDQYANLHGKLVTRIAKKAHLSGVNMTQDDANYVAHTLQDIMSQEVLFALIKYVGVEKIEDLLPENKQDELVGIFTMKQNLDVSPEDLEALKEQLETTK